jgi:exosome complex component RRP4
MKNIVTPGDLISEGIIRTGNTFVSGGKTYSKVLGIYENNSHDVVPLEGVWNPRTEDSIVGIVSEAKAKVYMVELSYFGKALLIPGKFDKFDFEPGDMLNAIISEVENKKTIILKDPRKLEGGTILSIKPKKIPRVIGKKSTMIKQIADSTGSHIIVGMNGLIWLSGGNITLATEAILKIEREAHTSGLTEAIKNFLDEKKVK